jgi:hypothetical protein
VAWITWESLSVRGSEIWMGVADVLGGSRLRRESLGDVQVAVSECVINRSKPYAALMSQARKLPIVRAWRGEFDAIPEPA